MNIKCLKVGFLLLLMPSLAFGQGDSTLEMASRDIVEAFYQEAYVERDAQAMMQYMAPGFTTWP